MPGWRCRNPRRCDSRSRWGTIVSAAGRPITSAFRYPKVSSAARLNSRMRPSWSRTRIESRAESRMADSRALMARSSASNSLVSCSAFEAAPRPPAALHEGGDAVAAVPRRTTNSTPARGESTSPPPRARPCRSAWTSETSRGSRKDRSKRAPTGSGSEVSSSMPLALTLSITPSMGSGSADRRDHTVRRTGIRVERRRGTRRSRSSRPSQTSGSTGVSSTTLAPAARSASSWSRWAARTARPARCCASPRSRAGGAARRRRRRASSPPTHEHRGRAARARPRWRPPPS